MAAVPDGRSPVDASESAPPARGWAGLGRRLIGPVLILVAALALPGHILSSGRSIRGEGIGPTAWPRVMLGLIAVLTAIWILQEWRGWRRAGAGTPIPAEAEEPYSLRKAAGGLALVVLYGWLLPMVGFPLATAAFVALWCLLGGLRNPVGIAAVALVGTAALLWLFMGVATMPLSRGTGAFDRISIAILQMLGIY